MREEFKPKLPSGMFGFVFNTRRPLFQDLRVREALTWLSISNGWTAICSGRFYDRTESFWQNSDLSSLGHPASPQELALIGDMKKTMEPAFLDWILQVAGNRWIGPRPQGLRKPSIF